MADAWKIFGVTLIVLIAIISIILIFQYLSRECNANLDCQQDEVCTVNHKCIPYPPSNYKSSIASSMIVGIAIILSAIIIKKLK